MASKEIGIRLSVKDKELVERALKSLGKEGHEALGRIEHSADRASVSLHALDVAANGVNRGMQRLKTGIALAAAGLAAGFTLGIKTAIERLEEMDRMSAQVDRALANTGNVAQTSAAELAAFADQLELRTGRAAEEIMAIGGNLATFKFDNEVFYRSIELANDMAAAWGGELKQNLEGLARALADPEKGFAMLEKRGISLSEAQGDLVKRFMAVNDIASAQRVILDALEADVKGVAEDGMTPLQTATVAAEKAMEDLFEDLVQGEGGSDDLRQSIIKLAEVLSDPNVLQAVRMFGNVLVASLRVALEFIGGVAAGLGRLIDFFNELEGKSDAGLIETRDDINRQILALENEKLQTDDAGGAMLYKSLIAGFDKDIAELRAQEAQITAMLDGRKAAVSSLDAPFLPTTVALPGTGDESDLPPPVLTPDQAKAQSQALREAQRLTEQLRTAAEDYAATIVDLDGKLAQGMISQETYNRATAKAIIEFAGAADSTEEYRLAQAELQQALADGIISETAYTEAVEDLTSRRLAASNDWVAGMERGLRMLASEGGDIGSSVEDALVSAANNFEDALVDAFKSGKFSWEDLRTAIMADMVQMGVKQGISGLAGLVSNLFNGGSIIPGVTGVTGGMRLGFQAGVGHSGAMIGASTSRRLVPSEVFSNAARHHTGTDFLKPGEVPFIGMRGEEIGWPDQLRRKYGGQGGGNVTVEHRTEIHNYGTDPVRTEQTKGADGVDVTKVIIGTVNSAIAEGRFDGALSGGFGLRRKGVS